MDQDFSFGHWLQRRRKALGLTQAQLDAQVGCAGATIRKIEADERRPSKEVAERLARSLGIGAADQPAFLQFARGLRNQPLPFPDHVSSSSQMQRRTPGAINLPTHATPLIGRQRAIDDLVKLLQRDDVRLLTLTGPGGIGKSRLALALAEALAETFSNGVVFVALTSIRTADGLVAAIADALKYTFGDSSDLRLQLVEHLRTQHLLLVLDNYEQLLPEIAFLADLLQSARQVKLLVTSRERLGSQWEWIVDVEGLRYPAGRTADDLETYSAVQLFVNRAQRVQRHFNVADHAVAVIRICQLVEGLPLAIELAAGSLHERTCAEIAAELEHNLASLQTDLRDVPDRHRSITAVFDHSWNLLSHEEQQTLMKLSIFQGGFTLEAAEDVADAPFLMLNALVDKSLVRLNHTERYDLHELLRQYVAGHLAAHPAVDDQTRQRHLLHFLELAEQAAPQLHGSAGAVWLTRLEQDHANFRVALDWAQTRAPFDTALRLAIALAGFWFRRGHWREGCDRLEALLRQSPTDSSTALRAAAYFQLARLYSKSANYALAYACAMDALVLYEAIGDVSGAAQATSMLGSAALHRGEYAAARRHYAACLSLYETTNDIGGAARVRFNLWILATKNTDFTAGRAHLAESVQLFRMIGDTEGLASALTNLGAVRAEIDMQYDEARKLSEESVALYRKLGDVWGLSYALNNLGEVLVAQGQWMLARASFEESLAIAEKHHNTYGIGMAQLELGNLAWHAHTFEHARKLYTSALDQLRIVGNQSYIVLALQCLARVYQSLDDPAQAVAYYARSLALHWDLRLKHCLPMNLAGLACLAVSAGQLDRAARLQGANDALVTTFEFGFALFYADRLLYEQNVAATRASILPQYAAAYADGQNMPLDQAIAIALANEADRLAVSG